MVLKYVITSGTGYVYDPVSLKLTSSLEGAYLFDNLFEVNRIINVFSNRGIEAKQETYELVKYGNITFSSANRSSKWPTFLKNYLKLFPRCAVCGTKDNVTGHHIKPFHLFPDLELVIENLITLCPSHHLVFGHLGDWSSYNVNVIEDCSNWNKKFKERP